MWAFVILAVLVAAEDVHFFHNGERSLHTKPYKLPQQAVSSCATITEVVELLKAGNDKVSKDKHIVPSKTRLFNSNGEQVYTVADLDASAEGYYLVPNDKHWSAMLYSFAETPLLEFCTLTYLF
jgi:molybdopterin biosynthesis enzyme